MPTVPCGSRRGRWRAHSECLVDADGETDAGPGARRRPHTAQSSRGCKLDDGREARSEELFRAIFNDEHDFDIPDVIEAPPPGNTASTRHGHLHNVSQDLRESFDPWKVLTSQRLEACLATTGEAKDREAPVSRASLPPQEPGALGALRELDGRMVAPLQRLGGLADRRSGATRMTTHDEQ
jgi:hypothetical protein